MKKVLIITGNYYPKPSANGICTHQIALALREMGYQADILCYKKRREKNIDEFEGIRVFRSKMGLISRLRDFGEGLNSHQNSVGKIVNAVSILLLRVNLFVYWPLYPMKEVSQTIRMFRLSSNLCKRNQYAAVISVFNPMDSLIVGLLLKLKYPSITFIPYFLDSITQSWGHKFVSKEHLDQKGWKWEKRVFSVADIIIAMKYHESEHLNNRYAKYKEKIKYLDIPLFRDFKNNVGVMHNPFNSTKLNFAYTGRLELNQYEPWYAISSLEKFQQEYKLVLHFYSRGSCEERLDQLMKSGNLVFRHGFVKPQEAVDAMMFSDALISVGTKESNMIPSKIFEYMATGKPIIHFYKQQDDVCLQYFAKYPLSLTIYENDQFEDNLHKIQHFLDNIIGKKANKEHIKTLFVQNTPEYTAKSIDELLNKRVCCV